MDSVTSGSKNSSSLPVLRGTLSGKIISWLGVVADLCHWKAPRVSWLPELGELIHLYGWLRLLTELIHLYGWLRLLTCITWPPKMVFFSCEPA